ncbi:hypothetical protein [Acetobacter oeni]|uniref:Uncharacterized protein n=1 Tax=Acetobacter oeni TaxID=304077 RepID=A0A511XFR1_9PROT|nr:hypothetical protein [Acetobacter oeni]MBB3882301.1 hypothetical protein [Acetobacter oeni]NHO18053.1 hypothetical protein [Acetobacter oeni]GBR01065.1 hypothetical protein AA21952_0300 [Acetobacter oeni LMG 21952]GEN61779.1 hypothetical protein AOE01nite_00030 [Acetobacter oeni]
MKQHKVILGGQVLYQAAQLSHAEVFAAARRAEGQDCRVVPDETQPPQRELRINPLTGKPRRGRRTPSE